MKEIDMDGWDSRDKLDEYLALHNGVDASPRLELYDVAGALKVTTADVRHLCRKRKLAHFKMGKKITVSKLQLAEYLLSLPQEVEVRAVATSSQVPAHRQKSQTGDGPKVPPMALTLAEAAAALRVSPATVRRLVRERGLGHIRIGSRLLIRTKDLETFLERAFVPPFDAKEEARKILEGRIKIGRPRK